MAKGAVKYKNMAVAKQPQELGRLRVLGGPDAGSLFVITSPRVSIGRGDENEVVVVDLKMSRRHAEISQTPQGMMIRDLGSTNGMAVNGQVIKQWFLKNGDKVGIGSTVFEFLSGDASPAMLTAAPTNVSQSVGSGTSGLTQFIRLNAAPDPKGGDAGAGQANLFEKNKRVILVMVSLVIAAIVLPQAEFEVKKRRRKYQAPAELQANSTNLKAFLPDGAEDENKTKADSYFKEGYREYLEHNYLRARSNFEVALQVYPAHEMARVYKENTIRRMEEDAKLLKEMAKRDEDANRLTVAMQRYDEIRRMYFKDQSNPIYKEADEAYKVLEKKVLKGK